MKKISKTSFTTYHNHRAEPYFTFIKNGQKMIEGRIKQGLYRFVRAGDHIVVFNEQETDSVEVIVTAVRTYISIKEMLEKEPLKKILPNIATVEQGIDIYKQFYTDEQEREFGVVVIEVERIVA